MERQVEFHDPPKQRFAARRQTNKVDRDLFQNVKNNKKKR